MSREPWVWVQPGGWRPWGLPGATPAQLCPCPKSMFRVAAGRWPCTGPGRASAQTVLVTSAQAEVPVPVGQVRGAQGKGRGWMGQPANAGGAACPFDAETDSFVGRVWAQTSSERLSFSIPTGNMERLYINVFIFTACCQVKVTFPYATSWLDVNGKFCPSTCYQQWKTFKMYK